MTPEPDPYEDERAIWNFLVSTRRSRGIDYPSFVRTWTDFVRSELAKASAHQDFDELLQHGCDRVPLAIIVKALENAASMESVWERVVGTPRKRDQLIRTLVKAADAIDALLTTANITAESVSEWPLSLPDPVAVVNGLRRYASLLGMFNEIANETGVRSLVDLAKYLASEYVKRRTGTFHDRQVSGIIAATAGPPAYDETAHKMWRARQYERLDPHCRTLADFLVAIGAVTSGIV